MLEVNGKANVEYDVVSTNVIPLELVRSSPAVVVDTVMFPTIRLVVLAVTNDE